MADDMLVDDLEVSSIAIGLTSLMDVGGFCFQQECVNELSNITQLLHPKSTLSAHLLLAK
jgi:hypothetical protein